MRPIAWGWIFASCLTPFAPAFQQVPAPSGRTDREGLIPPSDRDAESWLKRAKDAAAAEDWKLAADTLMRVVEQYGEKTVSPDDGKRFVSALRSAQEQIASWPPEGLATYRVLYDAEVRQRLDAARQKKDLDALRRISRTFPYSTHGPEAINLLAAWLIDSRQAGEAVDLLNQLLELPHSAIPRWQTLQKLCLASALSGDFTSAHQWIEALRNVAKPVASAPSRGDAPADLTERVDSLAKFVEATEKTAGTASLENVHAWPSLLGSGATAGRMPPVDSVVSAETLVRDVLPGAQRVNTRLIDRLIKRTGRPVVWQMVTDGKALFISCPDGLIARDLGTFDFLWKAVPKRTPRDPRIEQQRQLMGTINVDNTDRLDELTTRSLYHEYRGALSTALGLVFLIEQIGTSNEQYPGKDGTPPANNIFVGDDFCEANSLRAYDAETGKAVWTKGRGGPVEDGLRYAHFLAPPIAVNDRLVVPVQIGADLHLSVFARDGKLQKLIVLGSGQPGMFPMNGVLPCTVHQGTLYVPTGAGMLIALSTLDFSLRWQTPYDRAPLTVSQRAAPRQWGPFGPATGGLAQPDEWLASPPVPCGGVVVLAPVDGESLLAFDRRTGKQLWAFPRGGHRYLVGADGRRVFVAGKSLLALDAASGQSAWSFDRSPLAGRPVLSGDWLLVPTESGLVRLRAATGEKSGEPMAGDDSLGNLFAFDGALYSLSSGAITKYPDLDRSRQIAEQTLEKNPSDRKALLRLASISAVRKDWDAALGFLERAAPEQGPRVSREGEEAELMERIGRQRVAALLNLAGTKRPAERMPLLDRARAAATLPDDQMRIGIAMLELLREQKDPLAAYRKGLELLIQQGEQPLSVEDELDAASGVVLAQQLDSIWRELTIDQKTALVDVVQQAAIADLKMAMEPSPPARAIQRLIQLGDGLGVTERGAWLDLEIAKVLDRAGDHEGECFFLRRCIERQALIGDPNQAMAMEAKLRLAAVLAYPGPQQTVAEPQEAKRLLVELRSKATSLKLPEALPQLPGKSVPTSVANLLDQLAAVLPPALIKEDGPIPAVLRDTPALELSASENIASQMAADVRSFSDSRHPFDPFSGILPVRILKQIKGVLANASMQSRVAWSNAVSLALDEEPAADQRSVELMAHPAAVCGPVAVVDAGTQACAIGLVTGRMLWPPVALDRSQGPLPDPPMVAVGQTIVIATDPSTLIAVPARSDASPLWRRRFSGRRLSMLGEAQGQLVAIEAESSVVCVIDPQTGRIKRQFAMGSKAKKGAVPANADAEATPAASVAVPCALSSRVLVYGGATGLVGRDIITGQVVWEHPASAGVLDIRRLDDQHVAITYPASEIEVLLTQNGESVRRVQMSGLALPALEMSLDQVRDRATGDTRSERLLIFAKTVGDSPQFVLHSVPMSPGRTPWQRELGRFASMNKQMINASADWVAAVQYTAQTADQQNVRGDNSPIRSAMILVFDKGTGRRMVESPFELGGRRSARDDGTSRLIKDVIVLDQRIIAVAPEGYYVLAKSKDAKPASPEPDESEEP